MFLIFQSTHFSLAEIFKVHTFAEHHGYEFRSSFINIVMKFSICKKYKYLHTCVSREATEIDFEPVIR